MNWLAIGFGLIGYAILLAAVCAFFRIVGASRARPQHREPRSQPLHLLPADCEEYPLVQHSPARPVAASDDALIDLLATRSEDP